MQRLENLKENLIYINQVGREIFVWINTALYTYRGWIVPILLVVLALGFIYIGYAVIPRRISERTGMPHLQTICVVFFTLFLCAVLFLLTC